MNNPLTQYIDLYAEHARTICDAAPDALNTLRPDAYRRLREGLALPPKGSEGYERISLPDMFAPDYGVNIQRVPMTADTRAKFRCDVPNISTLSAYLVGDTFMPGDTLAHNLPDGVVVQSLATFATQHPDIVQRHLNTLVPADNAAAALNTMLCQDGIVVYIPANVRLARPIQVVNIFNTLTPMMASRRFLIILDKGARADMLICDHTEQQGVAYLSNQVGEIFVGEGAHLNLCDMDESNDVTARIAQWFVSQQQDSYLSLSTMSLSAGTTRNNLVVHLNAPHAETRLSGMVTASGHQTIDNSTNVLHHVPHCRSNQLYKYVLDGDAQGSFEGSIVVDYYAYKTSAYQTNRNLLASTDARMHTKPQLEIYCDDVQCSHGATTGQLDENALFYMRQRGIPLRQARTMLMQAFMAEVIDTVDIEGLRERLHYLVEQRLNGRNASCAGCTIAADNNGINNDNNGINNTNN